MKVIQYRQRGFTLVEIAIVLVIIGLLLGGVLKGQEMINQAKIKNVVNDFNGMTAAYYSYQDRYRALAGDDPTATARWGAAVASGNGNGLIAGTYNAANITNPTAAQESNLFWEHMRYAGLIGGVTTGTGNGRQPNNAAGGLIGIQSTAALGFTGTIICSSNLPDKIAIAVDGQIDDQSSNSGQVRALLQAAPNPGVSGAAATAAYAETGANQYVLCKGL